MINVLFVCVHNSARSQMAEAFMNYYGKNKFFAKSAGLEPGQLNPYVVRSMQAIGIDISKNATKSTADMLKEGHHFDYVFTVCDGANKERCPFFPGMKKRIHWDLSDPSSFKGTDDEIMKQMSKIRDEIKNLVCDFISNYQD